MKKKTGFSFEEHKEYGAKLKELKDFSCHWHVKIMNQFGKNSKETRKSEQMRRKLDDLCSHMDDVVCAMTELSDAEATNCYYGKV